MSLLRFALSRATNVNAEVPDSELSRRHVMSQDIQSLVEIRLDRFLAKTLLLVTLIKMNMTNFLLRSPDLRCYHAMGKIQAMTCPEKQISGTSAPDHVMQKCG